MCVHNTQLCMCVCLCVRVCVCVCVQHKRAPLGVKHNGAQCPDHLFQSTNVSTQYTMCMCVCVCVCVCLYKHLPPAHKTYTNTRSNMHTNDTYISTDATVHTDLRSGYEQGGSVCDCTCVLNCVFVCKHFFRPSNTLFYKNTAITPSLEAMAHTHTHTNTHTATTTQPQPHNYSHTHSHSHTLTQLHSHLQPYTQTNTHTVHQLTHLH